MENTIISIMVDVIKCDRNLFEENCDMQEIWDSLTKVEAIFALEEEFDISFNENEIATVATPRDLIKLTIDKVG